MSKNISILVIVAIIVAIAALVIVKVSDGGSVATSSPSPTLRASATPTATPDAYAGWSTFTSEEFGFSFQYPPEWGDVTVRKNSGNTGTIFNGRFSGNEQLTFAGQTADYEVGIGAAFLNFFGCEKGSGQTYNCNFAIDKTFTVTPTQVLTTKGNETALIVVDTEVVGIISPTTRGAYVNLSGPTYKGIAFRYLNASTTSSADIQKFDNLVRSIK